MECAPISTVRGRRGGNPYSYLAHQFVQIGAVHACR